MDVLVFGAGSLGSLIGARLSGAHRVTLVGRAPEVRAVRESGLVVDGVESFTAHPDAVTDVGDVADRPDLAVVAVKSFDTPAAADALADLDPPVGAVVSLQNGMGNEATLVDRLSAPVVAGTTTVGARLTEPGRVAWTGRGETTVGPWTGDADDAADRVARAFDDAGLACERVSGAAVERVLWEKLAVNAAINPTTALARVPNGAVVDPPLADVARTAAAETARVARAHGVDVADDDAVGRALDVARRTAANRSSMLQDVAAGRRTEVGAISGHVVDRAPEGVSVPVNTVLASLVRAWERERGHRPDPE
jgi:2-dehydropantoate 2-reductase